LRELWILRVFTAASYPRGARRRAPLRVCRAGSSVKLPHL
jgi:hypothetical protein